MDWNANTVIQLLDTMEKWKIVEKEHPGRSDDGLMTIRTGNSMGLQEPIKNDIKVPGIDLPAFRK